MTDRQTLLGLDFSALRSLQFVFELGSFSEAADRLGQTQSNVSYTIARLRACFGDPLFVREGRKMVATERCRAIVAETSTLLETFQRLTSEIAFDPATASGSVTLSCNHYERMTILPRLLRNLRAAAPGITLKVTNAHGQGEEQLKRGECDLLLGPVQFPGEKVFKRRIRTDAYCAIMDWRNPLCSAPLSLGAIATAHHISVRFSGQWRPLYFSRFETMGIAITPVVELSEYGDIGGYVTSTDLIAIVPRQIAAGLGDGVCQRALPLDIPLEIDAFWTARTHQSPLHDWMRSQVALAARDPERHGLA